MLRITAVCLFNRVGKILNSQGMVMWRILMGFPTSLKNWCIRYIISPNLGSSYSNEWPTDTFQRTFRTGMLNLPAKFTGSLLVDLKQVLRFLKNNVILIKNLLNFWENCLMLKKIKTLKTIKQNCKSRKSLKIKNPQ